MPKPRSVKFKSVADAAADAVVRAPLDEVGADAALHDEIFDEMADFVVHERGADGGFESETFAQARARCCIRRRLPTR